jgi:chromosome segregation ATPase
MPLPFIIAAAALAAGAVGVKKGLEAKETFEEAKGIARRAERRYEEAKERLDEHRESVNDGLMELGEFKKEVFLEHIGHLVKVLEKGRAKIEGFDARLDIDTNMVRAFERQLTEIRALDLGMGLGQGALAGGAAAFGAYGMVGALASASTGTAIASLSGAAATNATLAWLGGGSLASGGFGVVGGMWALGGIVTGPALMIGGFVLASKAEEALTEAERYRSKVNRAIAEMDQLHTLLAAIEDNIEETRRTIEELIERYERVKIEPADLDTLEPDEEVAIQQMTAIGKTLREVLNTPILGEDGAANPRLKAEMKGHLQVLGAKAQ